MPGMGERAFAYAKACGIIGKSFTGKRMRELAAASRLSDLDRKLFPGDPRGLPEKELLFNLENRITARAVDSIIAVIKSFASPPLLFTLLVRAYEYADLKNYLRASAEGEKTAPAFTQLGRFGTVRFEKWPDIAAMIKDTPFDFLLDKKGALAEAPGAAGIHAVLDRHYYNALWNALFAMPPADRSAAERILADEISLKNAVWALRLRTYYKMTAKDVTRYLIDIPPGRFQNGFEKKRARFRPASLADDALSSLDFPLDNYAAWSSWRWKRFLNPAPPGAHWTADPRHFQNAVSRYLFKLSKQYFRSRPFSLDTVFCFIRLKQFEEDILTSCAEGFGMGMSFDDIFSMLGE